MSEHVLITLIATIGTIVTALISAVAVVTVKKLETQVNSRMDQLLEEARKAAALEAIETARRVTRDEAITDG